MGTVRKEENGRREKNKKRNKKPLSQKTAGIRQMKKKEV